MTRLEATLPFGRTLDGRMVAVDAVMRGQACECVCPKCLRALVAAKGEVYRHHFRHAVDFECSHARETAIHLFAKQVICERLQLALPDAMGVMVDAVSERRVAEGIIADVLATYDSGQTVAVEVWVAHQVPDSKVRAYNKLRQAAVEIDLRPYRLTDKSDEEWERAILFEAPRLWLSPPAYIREQRRLERERWLQQQRDRINRARELMRLAEAERVAAEKELQASDEALADEAMLVALANEARELEVKQQRAVEFEQARLRLAEQRAADAEQRQVVAIITNRMRREMQAPDLQQLVAVHGGYDKITAEAWDQYGKERETWQFKVTQGVFRQPPYSHLDDQ